MHLSRSLRYAFVCNISVHTLIHLVSHALLQQHYARLLSIPHHTKDSSHHTLHSRRHSPRDDCTRNPPSPAHSSSLAPHQKTAPVPSAKTAPLPHRLGPAPPSTKDAPPPSSPDSYTSHEGDTSSDDASPAASGTTARPPYCVANRTWNAVVSWTIPRGPRREDLPCRPSVV